MEVMFYTLMMVLKSLTLGRCTLMNSYLSEPNQVKKTLEMSASFVNILLALPLSSKAVGWVRVRQVEVRKLALCIHRKAEVLLSSAPSLGQSPFHTAWVQAPVALEVC